MTPSKKVKWKCYTWDSNFMKAVTSNEMSVIEPSEIFSMQDKHWMTTLKMNLQKGKQVKIKN